LWHRHFNRLTPDEARFELVESRRLLAGITQKPVDLLAWPYGECNAQLELLSAECGYRASWSVWKGTNNRHSRWRVPLGRRDNLARFVVKSSGFYALTKAKWHRRNGMNDYAKRADSGGALGLDGTPIQSGVALAPPQRICPAAESGRLRSRSRIFEQ
jgi:peptidoglycan/xylan/chitin deacetylase (PgdA/CDA1 family)